jgi:hypothetical protein
VSSFEGENPASSRTVVTARSLPLVLPDPSWHAGVAGAVLMRQEALPGGTGVGTAFKDDQMLASRQSGPSSCEGRIGVTDRLQLPMYLAERFAAKEFLVGVGCTTATPRHCMLRSPAMPP